MNVTLRQLRVFEAVASRLSYTRAAEDLHLSQPAVSMQIRQLEDEVELPLFEKIGKRIHLTEAGQEMYRCSQGVRRQLDETSDFIEALRGVKLGRLRISVATTANHFATRLLAAFIKKYEGTTFALDVSNRKRLLEQLSANETDIVIMGEPPEEFESSSEAFMENPLVVVAPIDHELARKRNPIPLARIAEEVFVVRERASGTRAAMERFFDQHGIPFRAGIEMTSNEAIKHAVEAGLGLGIVSVHTLELELEARRLAILNVEGFPIIRHWYLVHCQGKRLPPVAAAFRDFLFSEEVRPLRWRWRPVGMSDS